MAQVCGDRGRMRLKRQRHGPGVNLGAAPGAAPNKLNSGRFNGAVSENLTAGARPVKGRGIAGNESGVAGMSRIARAVSNAYLNLKIW
jgi:hypothetical protein